MKGQEINAMVVEMHREPPTWSGEPEGHYGWYVETNDPTPADGMFVGDYISVNSEGTLFIWGRGHKVAHQFEPGMWQFVFPQLKLERALDNGDYLGTVLGPGDTEPASPSKEAAFHCQNCRESS
jgi:hypothetical protein